MHHSKRLLPRSSGSVAHAPRLSRLRLLRASDLLQRVARPGARGLTMLAASDGEQAAATPPLVGVVCRAGVATSALIHAIVHGESGGHVEEVSSCTWHIDTKYYTADAEVAVLELPRDAPAGRPVSFPRRAEAVVLAYDAAEAATLEAVIAWFTAAGEGVSGAEVRLCVATGASAAAPAADAHASATDAAAHERASEWCIDAGFEHVPLPGVEASDGEAEGVARVREALHAHTWPGLLAKPRPALRPRAAAAAEEAVAPVAAAVPIGVADEVLAAAAAAASAEEGPEAENEDEFEALMGAMMQARDAAAGGAVPDSARRAAAASLALRMAALLGGDSDGDDSDE